MRQDLAEGRPRCSVVNVDVATWQMLAFVTGVAPRSEQHIIIRAMQGQKI